MTTEKSQDTDTSAEQTPSGKGDTARRSASKRRVQSVVEEQTKVKGGRRAGSSATKSRAVTASPSRRGGVRSQKVAEQAPAPPVEATRRPLPRLLARFRHEVSPALMQEFGYTSPMQVPRLSKAVLNIGLGEALQNPKAMENATRDLSLISGQRPVITRSRKSIAGFKIREGMAIGVTVTVRGRRMYEFLDRLLSSTLPRIRDFRGLSREAFDGRGNYTLGIREQIIFPEIDYNSIDRIRGLQVVIVTTARTDREGFRLLELFGMPFAQVGTGVRAA